LFFFEGTRKIGIIQRVILHYLKSQGAKMKRILTGVLLAAALSLAFTAPALAESKFRQDFKKSYEANRFDALGFLVRTNKTIIPGEILTIVEEAEKAIDHHEKMALLDLANTMATMYREWHGEGKYVDQVSALQKAELAKEEARVAEEEKWKKYENFTGNFILRSMQTKMEAQKLTPVIFPHWVHRLYYDCKACHPSVFPMKRTNSMTQAEILAGKSCGECHNGQEAFSAKDNCERCHVSGKPAEAALISPKKSADLPKLKASAERLGTGLNLDLLPNKNSLPFDKFGNIDWMLLKKLKVHQPKSSIKGDTKKEIRDNEILFESPMPYVKNSVFSHTSHTELMECASCHPEPFKEELGSTVANKAAMAQGASCGTCHNKVSFKFADCNRCHTRAIGEAPGKALLRKKQ
jgi:c(7)-type cytochrome triheme protein